MKKIAIVHHEKSGRIDITADEIPVVEISIAGGSPITPEMMLSILNRGMARRVVPPVIISET